MSDIREIRKHMESVRDTKKVTNAMHMIAATKMRHAKAELDSTRPYFDAVRTEIKRVFRINTNIESPYMYPQGEHDLPGEYAYLVITADKGLAGTYNQAVIRKTEELIGEHASRLYIIGEYGRRYFNAHKGPIDDSFYFTAQNPTLQRARVITAHLLEDYKKGKISKIFVVYTDLKSGISQEAHVDRILPLHRGDFQADTVEKAIERPFVFFPDAAQVLDNMADSYVTGFVYSALVDSFCCEQTSRMNAMEEASSNADEILTELKSEYNHIRQGKITKEITEVSSGARALARKNGKKKGVHSNE